MRNLIIAASIMMLVGCADAHKVIPDAKYAQTRLSAEGTAYIALPADGSLWQNRLRRLRGHGGQDDPGRPARIHGAGRYRSCLGKKSMPPHATPPAKAATRTSFFRPLPTGKTVPPSGRAFRKSDGQVSGDRSGFRPAGVVRDHRGHQRAGDLWRGSSPGPVARAH